MPYNFLTKGGRIYRTTSKTLYWIATACGGYKPFTMVRKKRAYNFGNTNVLDLPKDVIDKGKVVLRLMK